MEIVLLFVAYIILWSFGQGVIKHITAILPRAKSVYAMYVVAAILTLVIALIWGNITIEAKFLPIFLVGAYQTWGGYAQFRAYTHNLSRSSILMPLRFVVPIILAAVLLGEATLYTNAWIPAGAIFLLAATLLLLKVKKEEDEKRASMDWLFSIFAFIAIAGSAGFLMKVFASELEISRLTFLSYWYSGTIFGAVPMLLLERDDTRVLFRKEGLWVLLAGALIMLQLGIQYTIYQRIPLAIAEPILSFGTTFGSILVGFLIFNEMKELTRLQRFGFLVGSLGVIMLIIAQI